MWVGHFGSDCNTIGAVSSKATRHLQTGTSPNRNTSQAGHHTENRPAPRAPTSAASRSATRLSAQELKQAGFNTLRHLTTQRTFCQIRHKLVRLHKIDAAWTMREVAVECRFFCHRQLIADVLERQINDIFTGAHTPPLSSITTRPHSSKHWSSKHSSGKHSSRRLIQTDIDHLPAHGFARVLS